MDSICKPYLFLDIDGVLAPYRHPINKGWAVERHCGVDIPVDVLRWLRTLDHDRIVWSTSWGPGAWDLSDSLNLPRFPTMMAAPGSKKPKALYRYLCDNPYIKTMVLAEDRPYRIPPVVTGVTVTTDTYYGLGADHRARIDAAMRGDSTVWGHLIPPSKRPYI